MNIELIGQQFPTADIIASADIRMGYINSGVMLVRNTRWSRMFLQQWWVIADKDSICDQDAFDMLYSKLMKEESRSNLYRDPSNISPLSVVNKIKILPMDALNTHPPAMTYQLEYNQVLHLMGETSRMRQAVFYNVRN
jgi:hypothetical protein